jgi:hypothetical protein
MRATLLAGLLLSGAQLAAQETYTPTTDLPTKPQLLALYVGASWCGPCLTPEMKVAVHRMKPLLARRATETGRVFAAIGVALDWTISDGLTFLQPLEEYDEVVVGANWTNLVAVRYIWADSTATPGLPQVILLERTVEPGKSGIAVGPERVVKRIVGADAIERWVAQGAPLPVSD